MKPALRLAHGSPLPGGVAPHHPAGLGSRQSTPTSTYERPMPMIDVNAIVHRILAAANNAPDRIAADRAVSKLLVELRDAVKAMQIEAQQLPMMRAWNPEPPSQGEAAFITARRLSARLDEMKLAKRFGDATDVQRVLDITLRELRAAVLGTGQ